MIRVLHYIGSLAQGGSQAMVMALYRNIDRSQIQFDFVIHADGITPLAQEAQSLGAVIYTCPQFQLASAGSYVRWWQDFLQAHEEYRIVHSHVRSTAAIVLRIAKKQGRVTIAHSHSTSSGSGFSAIVKNSLQYPIRKTADYFMACSQVAGEWLFGKEICASKKYFNLRNAIETKRFTYDSSLALKTRVELGYADDDIVIGHVGRFADQKNHMFLLDVFYRVQQLNPRYKLLLVGDGELQNSIVQKAEEYGIQDRVQFTGVRQDVNCLMMAMDLFLFPSKYEGLGIVMIEAQAAGCPCIASNGVPEEAKISDLVEFIDLEQDIEYWAERILSVKKIERKNMYQTVVDHGYDIQETAHWVQEFYLNCKA